MDEAFAALSEIEGEQRANRKSILSLVKSRVDSQIYAAIELCIENDDESGRTHSLEMATRCL